MSNDGKKLAFRKVDRNKVIPLYYQVSEHLEDMINKGNLSPGERLLPEEYLAEQFEVSRPTINKAISMLIRKSLISRERGKGTYVRGKSVAFTLMQELVSLHEALKRNNIPFKTKVLKLKRQKADKNIAIKLGLTTWSEIIFLKRLRFVENEPFLLSESYIPAHLFPNLEDEDFSQNSLYELFEKKYHIPVIKTERYARAIKAFEEEAYLFRIPLGEPLIQLEGVAFTAKDIRVEYFNTKIRGDRAVLCTTLYKEKSNRNDLEKNYDI